MGTGRLLRSIIGKIIKCFELFISINLDFEGVVSEDSKENEE